MHSEHATRQTKQAGTRKSRHDLPKDKAAGRRSLLEPLVGESTHARLVIWLYASGLLVASLIVAGTVLLLANLRDRQLAETNRELQNLALTLAVQMDRSFGAIQLVQDSLSEPMDGLTTTAQYEETVSTRATHLALKDKISGLPYVATLTFISAQGKVLNSSRAWPPPDIDISDREYFTTLKANPQLVSFISVPVQNRAIPGAWTIHAARVVWGANRQFLGLLVATIDLRSFEETFAAISLGAGSSISLFRTDGILIARHPQVDATLGQKYTGFLAALADSNRASLRIVSGIDAKERLVAVHRLQHQPLVVTVSVEVTTALAAWSHSAFSILASVGALMVVVIAIIFAGARQVAARLRNQNVQLDAALNTMSQGLITLDVLERVVLCNARYIEMYDLSRDIVKPGCTFADLLKHRAERGHLLHDPVTYRAELLADIRQGKRSTFIVDTADGRKVSVTNEPMPNGGWLSCHEDVTERRKAEASILHMALHDSLTDLPNRRHFREEIVERLARLPPGEQFAILCLDLDGFKKVNDTLGHPVGDKLLRQVAGRMSGCLREGDTIARLGGDEFAILQRATNRPSDVIALARRLFEVSNAPFLVDGQEVIIGVTIGIAIAPTDATDPDLLLKRADIALYRAKSGGRGAYRFFEPEMDAQMQLRRALEIGLRKALVSGEFEIFYQPLFNLQRQELCGFEALIRWNHPEQGLVSPLDFIPLAEETALIVPIGEWVLRQACMEAMKWPTSVSVAVNLSPAQFKIGKLPQLVMSALAQSGLEADRLQLEITESLLLINNESTMDTLHQLRKLGVHICMDDFGIGYSSLSYLRSFPFDKIKIDASFVRNLSTNPEAKAIIRAVTGLGSSLAIATTGEGVETQEELDYLRAQGCTEAQGYFLGKPAPASDALVLAFKNPVPSKAVA